MKEDYKIEIEKEKNMEIIRQDKWRRDFKKMQKTKAKPSEKIKLKQAQKYNGQ